MRDWQATLEQGGYKIGVANPALFYNAEERCPGGVHGDDFVVVGSRVLHARNTPTWFWESYERHAELLSRVVSVGTNSDGRRYV